MSAEDPGAPRPGSPAHEEPLAFPEISSRIERVLVAVDGSPGSERAMAYASLVAAATGAEPIVVVAFDPPVAIRRRTGVLEVQHERVEMEAEAQALAEEAVALFGGRDQPARGIVIRGEPAEAIIEMAQRDAVDLIVMGRRGTGRLKGMLVGSVSERVARHSDVPVLLV